jgi:uncharacterized protein
MGFLPDLAWPAMVVFTGYVMLGLTGFGSALVIVPLLAWQWPLTHVVALTLLLDLPACMLHGGLNLKHVQWSEIWRMLPGLALGSGMGLWLMHILEPRWPLLMLGLYVLAMGLRQMWGPNSTPRKLPSQASVLAGGVAGLVEMMFGAAGPVLMTWLGWRLFDVMQLRATAPVLIVCSALIVLGEMALTGNLSEGTLWHHWFWLIGAALLGTAIGDRMARSVPAALLTRAMALLLVISGASLLKRFLVL